MKQFAARPFEFAPAWARIYFAQRVGHRAAAPQRHAEIVNPVGIPAVPHALGALDNAVHPQLKTYTSGGVVGRQRKCESHRTSNRFRRAGTETVW